MSLAKEQSLSSIALTDINNTSGCIDFSRLAEQYGVQPVIGIDFREGIDCRFIGLAKNKGFAELNSYLTDIINKRKQLTYQAPDFYSAFIIYPFSKLSHLGDSKLLLKNNEFIGIHASRIKTLPIFKMVEV
ncbi:MAG: hypothetical protein R2728_07365 [Chitinophagales bacterium]